MRFARVPWLLLLFVLVNVPALATVPLLKGGGGVPALSVDAEIRPEIIADARDAWDATGPMEYGTLRSWVGITIEPDERLLVRIAVQESRLLGTQASNGVASSRFAARDAYLQLSGLTPLDLELQVGRFGYTHGRGRFLGAFDESVWGPNRWDGVRIGLDIADTHWDLLAIQVIDWSVRDELIVDYPWMSFAAPLNSDEIGDFGNRRLFVLGGDLFDGLVQPLLYADINDYGEDFFYYIRAKEQYIAAVYLHDRWEDVSFHVDVAWQWLKPDLDEQILTDETGRAIGTFEYTENAGLFAAEVIWHGSSAEFGLGFDRVFGSYDRYERAGTGTFRLRNNPHLETPFMDHGRFLGRMNYEWIFQSRLSDYFIHATWLPTDAARVTLSMHRFFLDQFDPSGGVEIIDRGLELFLEGSVDVNRWVRVEAGYGILEFYSLPQTRWYLPAYAPLGGIHHSHSDRAEYGFLRLIATL